MILFIRHHLTKSYYYPRNMREGVWGNIGTVETTEYCPYFEKGFPVTAPFALSAARKSKKARSQAARAQESTIAGKSNLALNVRSVRIIKRVNSRTLISLAGKI